MTICLVSAILIVSWRSFSKSHPAWEVVSRVRVVGSAEAHWWVKLHADEALLRDGFFDDGEWRIAVRTTNLVVNGLSQGIEWNETMKMRQVCRPLARKPAH